VARSVGWIVLVAASLTVWLVAVGAGFDPGEQGSDAWNYLAAGERLNAGHPLYALSPGDRAVTLQPPYWTVPLLAPPPIAVVWRPLALLGEPAMTLWAVAGLIATVATAAYLLARGGLVVAAIIAAMSIPLALQSTSGNVNGLLFAGLVVAWLMRDRVPVVAVLIGAAIAIKLTPALLLVWLVSARRWRAALATVVAVGVIGVVSLAGAGIQAHLDWLASVPTSQPAPLALATLTGLPSVAILVLLGIAVGAAGLRRDERLTFSVAVLAAALASPALYLGTFGIAAAAAAPWLAPSRSEAILTSITRRRPAVQAP
jgi:alpha-1,2-mannosyltransferase